MEKKKKQISKEEVVIIIKENFSPGRKFQSKDLKRVSFVTNLNASYFLNEIAKTGAIVKIDNRNWVVPNEKTSMPGETPPLYVSMEEKGILQKIFNMELKAFQGKLRFNLKKLKELISEDDCDLIADLLPKLKKLGIMNCVGNGISDERIIEVNEDVFLKYMVEDHIKIISITDIELDKRINHLISETERRYQLREKVAEELEEKISKLTNCLEEIKNLEKQKESLEKDVKALQSEYDKLKNIDDETVVEHQFIASLSEMSPERRRAIFKKVLGK